MTWRTPEDLKREARDAAERLLRGLVRRFAITLTEGTLWRMLGQRGGQGGDETRDLETFPGIGIYARPPSSGNPEAIALAVGGAKHQVVVATRDEATRQAALGGDVQPGETCLYNGQGRIILKADGTAEIRLHSGVAEASIKGETYRSAEDALLTALSTFTAAIATHCAPTGVSPDPPLVTACATFEAAIATFQAAAAAYLTTVLKAQ
jgi:phage gp45-like